MKASSLLSLSLAALLCTVSAAQPAFAQPAPQAAAKRPAQDPELQAAIAKSNAYTSLANRTLRAVRSWDRYKSWVDMKKGPTGKERYISYGLYSLYDVKDEIAKAEAATGQPPAQPELDGAVKRYIAAYQELAPLITRAERYYQRKDYRDDNVAEGRELHARMVPAAEAFLRERTVFSNQLSGYKKGIDARELAAIEASEGRQARWQLRNIMINARAVMDYMPSNEHPIVDLAGFDTALAGYAAAIRRWTPSRTRTRPACRSSILRPAPGWARCATSARSSGSRRATSARAPPMMPTGSSPATTAWCRCPAAPRA